MILTSSEKKDLKCIQDLVIKILQEDSRFKRLTIRKEQILNYLTIVKKNKLEKDWISEYEELSNQIKKIEIETAYKLLINQQIKNKTKRKSFWRIIGKKRIKKKIINKFNDEFNNIIQDDKYKEKMRVHNNLFKKLINANEEEKELLYELESVEIQLATIETDAIRDYFINNI